MPGKARKAPDFMTNSAIADLVSAFLADAATEYGRKAEESGTSSLAGATMRLVAAAAGQMRDVHGLNDEPETGDESAPEENGWQG